MTENTALNMLNTDEYHLTFHVLSVLDERLEFLDLQFWTQRSHQRELAPRHNLSGREGHRGKKLAPYYHYNRISSCCNIFLVQAI